MGILATASKGVLKQKPIIILYGDGGLGKDTWASKAPKPYFIDVEGGTGHLDVVRSAKPSSYDEVLAQLDALATEQHDFQTLVLSGLDVLEGLLFQKICAESNAKSMVMAAGGYGNGYKIAVEYWTQLQAKLASLRSNKNLQIIIICHSLTYTYNDPTTPNGYDRIRLKLHEGAKESASRLWFDFADCVLFAKKKIYHVGEKLRAMDDGKHYIYTQGRAAFDAKSRYPLPFEIELDYGAFESALNKPRSTGDILKEILALADECKEPAQAVKIREAATKHKDSPTDLANILEQAKTILQRS